MFFIVGVCRFFMNKWLIAAGVLAVLLVAVAAFAHGHGARGSDWWGSKGWKDVGGKGWKDGAGWRRGVGYANVTLSVATRQVTISGDGIKVVFTVDVVGVNVTRFGRVVYGTGSVELGGVSYTAKSVAGFLGGDAARFTIYTGNAIIKIKYYNGMYYAVVKPLDTAGYQRFNGTATLTVT
jgi:hypothetical protein